eukprot:TRINITY_DN16894_c0_g2_i1.p4 TRINITY_DN16894_c0_g2~~TRINITY_DN16894_c0_g2_i1.p4  ORF type:complete len:163 (+),score=15.34 TRINITY_DN16894_c0_g2_i1:755-1243(+)
MGRVHGGGGGRIALVVTNVGADFSAYTGTIQARSSRIGSRAGGAGAGTIYKQCAADRPGRGSVWVDNSGLSSSGFTDIPPSTNDVGEVERATFYVTNAATLRLVNNFAVGDVWLPAANASLNLNFKALTVHSKLHALGAGSEANYGSTIWMPDVAGTTFTIR